MKKSLSARRVPRKIGSDDDEAAASTSNTAESPSQVVQRPVFKSKKSSQVRSFKANDDTDAPDIGVIAPKRSTISRIAVQRNASQRSNFAASDLPRAVQSTGDDGPTYSAADLNALKQNTPSTSQKESDQSLDVRDKFGSTLIRREDAQSNAIPSATEIAEKKARRARLALESKAEEYISLDPDDPGWDEDEDGNVLRDMDGRLVLREKDKYGIQSSRLVRDDEDVMEGFDDFTGEAGSRIIMGASAKQDERQAKRNEIAEQIAHAEDVSGSEDDPEETMRNAAFEAVQTRHGTYAENDTGKQDPYAEYRAKTPTNITPLPDLEGVLGRLRSSLLDMETRKREKESEMERLTKEKFRIRDEEVRVQQQLKEVGEKFRQIKIEKGILPKDDVGVETTATENGQTQLVKAQTVDQDDVDDQDVDDEPATHAGLGLGNAGAGLGWS